jgi:hypothetical protein
MMKLIRDLKIKHKLMLMLFFPFMGLIYFASVLVLEKADFYFQMKTLEQNSQLSLKVTELVYRLQHERMFSLFYLQTPSTERKAELEQRISNTVKLISEIEQEYHEAESKGDNETLNFMFNQLRPHFETVIQLRQQVADLKATQAQAFDGYSKINQSLIDLLTYLVRDQKYAHFFRLELARLNVAAAKEKAALERSLLVQAFKQRYFEH